VNNSVTDGKSVAMIDGIQFLFKQYKDYHQALQTPALALVAPALAPAAPGLAAPGPAAPGPGSWRALAASISAHVHSVIQVQGYIREFYGSYIFKMKNRHLKQAKMAMLSKGVSKLLYTAECKKKWTEIGNDTRVLFAVGDGNFGSTKGPVLHQQFISFLKKKTSCFNLYSNEAGYRIKHNTN
ncbi:hypothetical protein BGX20_005401, partial [Mortierella sp. AD010]